MTTKEEQVRADIATKFGSIPKMAREIGRRFKSCPADHEKPQVTRLNAVAFFVACAKRVQKMSAQNKKSAQAEAQAHILVSRFHAQERKHDGNHNERAEREYCRVH